MEPFLPLAHAARTARLELKDHPGLTRGSVYVSVADALAILREQALARLALQPGRWICMRCWAAASGLPASLEDDLALTRIATAFPRECDGKPGDVVSDFARCEIPWHSDWAGHAY